LLKDNQILEISCAGEKTAITVYHLKYGLIETNLSFENITKLNLFILGITKSIGLHINSNNPVIDGYLPNGYKVEGLYSVGDISNKGSYFIIKKYLDKPLTPISLINASIGSIDIYAYIWTAIDMGYQIILHGGIDNLLVLNSIALFYPDKQIVSIQEYDSIKLPQSNWIKRLMSANPNVDKKTVISQSISQRPYYIIVDHFSKDILDISWFNINLFTIDSKLISEITPQIKSINQNALIIEFGRISTRNGEKILFKKITEIYNKNEFETINLDFENLDYKIDLLSSNINIVKFNEKKKIVKWMFDSEINDYKDFNSIVNDYFVNRETLLKRLEITTE
ncbi:MAG: hypothetical protein V1824_00840, partial [archaeon]